MIYMREASPLFNSPLMWQVSKRGVSPMIRRCSYHNLPLPLEKGKGIQGIGLPNYRYIKGGEVGKQ